MSLEELLVRSAVFGVCAVYLLTKMLGKERSVRFTSMKKAWCDNCAEHKIHEYGKGEDGKEYRCCIKCRKLTELVGQDSPQVPR